MRAVLTLLAIHWATTALAAEPRNNTEPRGDQLPAEWGTILGRIVFDGDDPPIRVVPMLGPQPREAPPPENQTGEPLPVLIPEDSLLVGANGGLANAFVYLRSKPSKIHPSDAQAPPREHDFEATLLRFVPHALIVRPQDKLLLRNRATEPLNIAYYGSSQFNLMLKQGETREWQLKETDNIPQRVKSNIKQWMSASILVRDNSYACVTNARGIFAIPNLPLGEPLEIQLWHERAGYLRGLTTSTGHQTTPVGQLRITLTDAVTDVGELRVPRMLFKE